jgi:hypothetical protein
MLLLQFRSGSGMALMIFTIDFTQQMSPAVFLLDLSTKELGVR